MSECNNRSVRFSCIFNTLCIFSIPPYSQSLNTHLFCVRYRKEGRKKGNAVKMNCYDSNVLLNKCNYE